MLSKRWRDCVRLNNALNHPSGSHVDAWVRESWFGWLVEGLRMLVLGTRRGLRPILRACNKAILINTNCPLALTNPQPIGPLRDWRMIVNKPFFIRARFFWMDSYLYSSWSHFVLQLHRSVLRELYIVDSNRMVPTLRKNRTPSSRVYVEIVVL